MSDDIKLTLTPTSAAPDIPAPVDLPATVAVAAVAEEPRFSDEE